MVAGSIEGIRQRAIAALDPHVVERTAVDTGPSLEDELAAKLDAIQLSQELRDYMHDQELHVTQLRECLAAEVSERKRLEQALEKANEQIAHAARVLSLGELTSSIAHEVNQPLAAIIANSNACLRWLLREEPNIEEARLSLERIILDGERASRVVQRIRALASKTCVTRVLISVNDIIEDVLDLTTHELLTAQIALRRQFQQGLPEIAGDPIQLQQVVLNLLLNGIESMRTTAHRERELRIASCSPTPGTVEVSFSDSGVGISPETGERLFEAFYTSKPDGLGLGLSISRRIIEAHGGELRCRPNPHRGVTMSFCLPAAKEECQ